MHAPSIPALNLDTFCLTVRRHAVVAEPLRIY
jgi:hypothetical protein